MVSLTRDWTPNLELIAGVHQHPSVAKASSRMHWRISDQFSSSGAPFRSEWKAILIYNRPQEQAFNLFAAVDVGAHDAIKLVHDEKNIPMPKAAMGCTTKLDYGGDALSL